MGTGIPDYVTHYYVAGRPPFLNLSDLPDEGLAPVLAELAAERLRGVSARVFGSRYVDLRKRTEAKLWELFVEIGGKPRRMAPHYFVLGSSRWFEGLSTQMQEIRLAITDLPSEATSFTVPDSFTAMGLGADYGLHFDPKPHHGQVYRLSELNEVIGRCEMPIDEPGNYAGYERAPFEKYVEIQLWTDGPVSHLTGA
jgi:hypothetical protein